jgi:hypothetical protein
VFPPLHTSSRRTAALRQPAHNYRDPTPSPETHARIVGCARAAIAAAGGTSATLQQIAAQPQIGVTHSSLKNYVRALVAAGDLARVKKGLYRLATKSDL